MTVRIGINGFGRMGRLGLRAGWGSEGLAIVRVNEIATDATGSAHLLKFDSVHGIWDEDCEADGEVLTELTADKIRTLTRDGVIAGGMIPKTETALAAIDGGVRAVVILDGRAPNACLLELFTEHGSGSLIRAD